MYHRATSETRHSNSGRQLEARAGFNLRRNEALQRQQSRLDKLRVTKIASLHHIDEGRVPLVERASENKRSLIFAKLVRRAKLRIVHKLYRQLLDKVLVADGVLPM